MIHIDFTTSSIYIEVDLDARRVATVRLLQGPDPQTRPTQVVRVTNDGTTILTHDVASREGIMRALEYDLREPGTYHIVTRTRNDPRGDVHVRAISFTVWESAFGILSLTILPGSSPSDWICGDESLRFDGQRDRTLEIRLIEILALSPLPPGESPPAPEVERSTAWARILQDDEPDSV